MDRSCGSRCLAVAAAGFVWVAGACGPDEEGPGVRLVLRTEVGVPGVVDGVDVEVIASRLPTGETCAPQRRSFPLAASSDLPLRVLYEAGPEFRSWVGFRVTWRKGMDPVLTQTVVRAVPADGIHEVTVELSGACLTQTCRTGEQCMAGACVPVPSPDPFDPSWRVAGFECDVPR